MISVIKATEENCKSIVSIGKVSIAEAHRDSTSEENINEYLGNNYNDKAIKEELNDSNNIYHIINYKGVVAGFSKIILNDRHPNNDAENVTKLDRIYLLKEFYGLKLGLELLNFNIELSKNNNQSGMWLLFFDNSILKNNNHIPDWLYTWVGNNRAVNFYLKAGFKIIGSHKFYVTETHYNLNHHMFLNFLETDIV